MDPSQGKGAGLSRAARFAEDPEEIFVTAAPVNVSIEIAMRMVNPISESIDEIGKKVLKAMRVQDQDLDEIVAEEDLFYPVRAAIRAGERQSVDASRFVWMGPAVRWRLAFASVAVIALGIIGVVDIVRQTAPSREIVHETTGQNLSPEFPPSPEIKPYEKTMPPEPASISAREGVHQTLASATRHVAKRQLHSQIEVVGEFQALTYTGDTTGSDNTGQIVRVELPRSSLFAMGVDVPVENQTTNKIKADLLIGDDGVMKAVRIVSRSDR
jgi:hypothetical protein